MTPSTRRRYDSPGVLEVTFTAQDPLVAAAAVNNAMDI